MISGFTIIRNGELYGYPFKEAILSILPVCDELIVNAGVSEDNTLDILKSINNSRIIIDVNEWDMSLREGGKLLSVETNRALKKCRGNWCFYIQGDEVIHEKYLPEIESSIKKYNDDTQIEGLQFRYKHFYGSYDFYQDNNRKWYSKEIRVIRRNENIVSWGDAMDFRHKDGSKLRSAKIDAEVYHYGWVRPPDTLMKKRIDFEKMYKSDEELERIINNFHNYDDLGNLKRFNDTHPKVMEERIKASNWNFDSKIDEQNPDWFRKIINFLHPVTKRINKVFKND